MSVAQALAIAAAGLVLAGDPWGGKLAMAEAYVLTFTAEAEAMAECAVEGAMAEFAITTEGSSFDVTPDGERMKRTFAVL